MFSGIDHLMFCVPDLDQATRRYRQMGFDVRAGGVHPGKGTRNAIAFNDDDYLELLAVHDAAEYAAGRGPGATGPGLPGFIAAGGGIRFIVIRSDDLAADVAAMRTRGVDVSDAIPGSRRTPEGVELHWKSATLGPDDPLPVFFIEHLTPLALRRGDRPAEQPNRVFRLERTYVVTDDAARDAARYARVLGVPVPKMERGTVIMADMAVFQLGAAGLGIAQPYAAGPAADALQARGPGPFQALYRTRGMSAAAAWMEREGLPKPARGVRNTGEHAMLVPPDLALGAYIGFVGPA